MGHDRVPESKGSRSVVSSGTKLLCLLWFSLIMVVNKPIRHWLLIYPGVKVDARQSHRLRCQGLGVTWGFPTVSLSDMEPMLTRLRKENREQERQVRERGQNQTKSIIRLEYMIESDTGYIEAKKQDCENMKTNYNQQEHTRGNTGWEYM
jgi:hypothetical protein